MNLHLYFSVICFGVAALSGLVAFGGIMEPPFNHYAVGWTVAFLLFGVMYLGAGLNPDEGDVRPELVPLPMPDLVKSIPQQIQEMAAQLEDMAYSNTVGESQRKHYMRESADRLRNLANAMQRANPEAGETYPGTARRMDGGGRFG